MSPLIGKTEPVSVSAGIRRLKSQGLEILVEDSNHLLYASDRPGLAPVCDLTFNFPHLLDGSDVYLHGVDLGIAYILIFGKVGRVFAGAMTNEAKRAFKELGIEHEAQSFARKLPDELAKATAKWDTPSHEAVTPLAFVEMVKRKGV